MQNLLLLIFPILLFVITFYCATLSKKGLLSDTFLDLDQSKNIQAFACLAIIIHHVTQQISVYGMRPKGPITLFSYIGYLFTALFFFFSGYGLMTSLNTKPDYLKSFLKKRLPAVLIPFWIINVLAVILVSFLPGPKLSASEIACAIAGVTLINGNGWYIIEIVFFYIIFHVLFRFVKNRKLATALLCIATVCIIVYGFLQGHNTGGTQPRWFEGEWWYNSTITFAFGVLFAGMKDKFSAFCVKHYKLMLALFAVLTIVSVRISVFAQKHLGYYHEAVHHGMRDASITLVIQSVSAIIFTSFVLILNMRLSIGNRALLFIRNMSLELFLIHGLFVNQIFGSREMSDFVRYTVVFICSILCTALIAPVVKFLVKKITALLNTKRVKNDTLEQAIFEKQRAKLIKIFGITAGVLIIAAVIYSLFGRSVILKGEHSKEQAQLKSSQVGDIVEWGHFDINPSIPGKEHITWIVLEKDDQSALLISEMGLAGSYYHQHHMAISWEDSDLRRLINSDKSIKSFSKYERPDMLSIDGDLVSLLTASEAEKLFSSDVSRELLITPMAKAQGTNINDLSKHHEWDMTNVKTSWWWLRGDKGVSALTAPIVTVDGVISLDEKYVNKPAGAIRPVIRVKINQIGG